MWELACLRKLYSRHNISIANTAAFAASLKLDSSHTWPRSSLEMQSNVGAGLPAKAVFQTPHLYRQYRRLRSLAKARQLSQLTAFIP